MLRSILAILLLSAISTKNAAAAPEVCGLQNASFDVIFKDGFQPAIGLGPALGTVDPPGLGIAPTVTITSPLGGAVNGRVQVTGTFTGPAGTGVSVNGARAYVRNGMFVTQLLSLPDGSNAITATATTLDGLIATDSKNISSDSTAPRLSIASDASVGFKPLGIGLNLSLPLGINVQTVTVNYGDGSPMFQGNSLSSVPRHTYANAGFYKIQVDATDMQAKVYSASYSIAVLDVPELRQSLCATYAHLRSRMAAGDSQGALQAFHVKQRQKFGKLFTALGTNLPIAAGGLGVIANGTIGTGDAEFILVKEVGNDIEGYPLHMSPGVDGVWRIDSMYTIVMS